MARKSTVGYVVTGPHAPMGLGHNKGEKDTLFFGCAVTIFETRRRAKRAIKATIDRRPTFEQEFGLLLIHRCESEAD